MVTKMKMCAGFDGNEHEAYIYKNINGKKYCKFCTQKLQPPKQITKRSEKQIFKMTLKKQQIEDDMIFYQQVWEDRTWRDDAPGWLPPVYPKCEVCQQSLGSEPNLMYFHHILEKRNYPELRHTPENIAILCPDCHTRYETYPDKVPYLVKKKEDLFRSEMIRRILQRD